MHFFYIEEICVDRNGQPKTLLMFLLYCIVEIVNQPAEPVASVLLPVKH